jgi:hypothetical protein
VWRCVGFPSSSTPSASIALCALAASLNSYFLNVYFIAYKVVKAIHSLSVNAVGKIIACFNSAANLKLP